MRGFFQIFTQYGGVLLFLFLEGVCFYTIVRFNQKQEQIFIHSANRLIGNLNDWIDDKGDYFTLKEEIKDLQKENSELYKKLGNSLYNNYMEKPGVDSLTGDSLKQKFTYIYADIINKTILGSKNFFTLDKGSSHGVKPHMGVIGVGGGLIGIVTNVSGHFSTVMTVLHRDMSISAKIRQTGYFGSLTWDTKNPMILDLEYIPRHTSVEIGDTVETSGYSNMFPEGCMIGVVEKAGIKSSGDNYEIKVKLKTDLRQVQNAYIVKNLMMDELQGLVEDQR